MRDRPMLYFTYVGDSAIANRGGGAGAFVGDNKAIKKGEREIFRLLGIKEAVFRAQQARRASGSGR